MTDRIKNLKTNPTQNIDDLLNDIEIKNYLILGTHKQETVPVFPKACQDKMRDFIAFMQKTKEGYIPPTDEAIDLIRRGEALFDEICNTLEATDANKGLLSIDKPKLKEQITYALYLTVYSIKRYVLIPIFSDEERRKELAEKVGTLSDGDIVKNCLFDLKNRGAFLSFDAMSLISPELIKMGKWTEQERDKALYDLAYEESVVFEQEAGIKEANMPTQRQKDYISYRMGKDEGEKENAKQN